MARAGYTDWIWIPFFRRCWIGPDKVEVTRPIIFGRGFLFDGSRRVVTIRRCPLGRTLSEEEIPFSELNMKTREVLTDRGQYPSDKSYRIELMAPDEKFHIGFWGFEGRADRVLAAIQTLGIR